MRIGQDGLKRRWHNRDQLGRWCIAGGHEAT
jgi:hypothetical protein